VRLLQPVPLGRATAPNRLMFGPHVTNLGDGRAFSGQHVAYYERRAAGGAGIIVTETASVHESDWPYERAPLATQSSAGWAEIAAACARHGPVTLASVGHFGGQGSSAFSQRELWAPSGVPEVNTREMPKVMEPEDIAAVVGGFAAAARLAVAAGLAGVEVNAGQHSLVRQFLSGLTNTRADGYGTDRLRFVREVLGAVKAALGGAILGLRLSCDELAPWAGITPEQAAPIAAELASTIDYLVVVRGAIYSAAATRPDAHTAPGFNLALTRDIRAAVAGLIPVFAQGSIVDPAMAEQALADGSCDGAEMTRAQIADAALGHKIAAGVAARPCILCNQACQVLDSRNPIVSCVADPRSGHETQDEAVPYDDGETGSDAGTPGAQRYPGGRTPKDPPAPNDAAAAAGNQRHPRGATARVSPHEGHAAAAAAARDQWRAADAGAAAGHRSATDATAAALLVIGAGPAGLEAARVAAIRGHRVRIAEASGQVGGTVAIAAAAPGRAGLTALTGWLAAECRRLGVEIELGRHVSSGEAGLHRGPVIAAIGGRDPRPPCEAAPGTEVVPVREFLAGVAAGGGLPSGPVLVWDPIGGPIGVSVAEMLAPRGPTALAFPDHIPGQQLALSGDLVSANARLQSAGVTLVRRCGLRRITASGAEVEDTASGGVRTVPATLVIDAGPRLPARTEGYDLIGATAAGDAVAPRTIYSAVLEGRRAALALGPPDRVRVASGAAR
jgi:2,4-dienoyl-CoA reductase-like NADH-dependent reductase (Old Yellow Enzyme family)